MQLIECVPNFSEGRNPDIVNRIAAEIRAVTGVKLLNIDPGKAANRTVITFAGEPGAVVEAAYRAIKMAGELIDMSRQTGEHPRIGATDVCPLIPLSNISMAETAEFADKLARRVGNELNIPVYLYENSQPDKSRSNLSVIRSGEYEGFFDKIKLPGWQPDYGPQQYDAKRGATVIGARDFLIAYNVNLDTVSVPAARAIAKAVRESGHTNCLDENGKPKRMPGKLKSVKAIGWYIEEYVKAQVSMNLTNINITPVHIAFEAVKNEAAKLSIKVTGSELIGLIPLKCMTGAGSYFLHKQNIPYKVSEDQLVNAAIKYLGLDELAPFDPQKRVIEYVLGQRIS